MVLRQGPEGTDFPGFSLWGRSGVVTLAHPPNPIPPRGSRMVNDLGGLFSDALAIDLRTAHTLIFLRRQGIVLTAPAGAAAPHGPAGREVAAVGTGGKRMLGRTPGNITTHRPMKDGVIADFTHTEEMLKQFIKKVHRSRFLRPSPRVLICVPCGSTQVERRAIKESAEEAGAREVYLIEEPMAAPIGAGIPCGEARGSRGIHHADRTP